jgi:hypothetical protein
MERWPCETSLWAEAATPASGTKTRARNWIAGAGGSPLGGGVCARAVGEAVVTIKLTSTSKTNNIFISSDPFNFGWRGFD